MPSDTLERKLPSKRALRVSRAKPIPNRRIEVNTRVGRDGRAEVQIAGCEMDMAAFGEDALVYLEASRARTSSFERIELGSADRFQAPTGWIRLGEFESDVDVRFRFLVMNNSTYRILAAADGIRIRSDAEGERNSGNLITLRRDPNMGEELLRAEVHPCNGALIFVNARIPDLDRRLNADAVFYAAVMHGALLQIVTDVVLRGEELQIDPEITEQWRKLLAECGVDASECEEFVSGERGLETREVRDWIETAAGRVISRGRFVSTALHAASKQKEAAE
ncbi:hypothetical protein CKO28_06125 [Rhodovibrio sodomensis]|uniref:Hedgehog/Intein (Hint) domain-containing protein n=1 Tax=Rhodovibrio sodomensis TaxID=1088 RepID=A0ABS1DCI6_9PROT|nr:hypothetical protein [Rhodovibrio sodomensis]MBK1667609.1 hypothetical protein [Rhodovibrio sodomensis]